MQMWKNMKSSKVFWLALGCGLLVISAVVVLAILLAPRLGPGIKGAHDLKSEDSVVIAENVRQPGDPWWNTTYVENSSAINSTPATWPLNTTSPDAETLPTTEHTCRNGWSGYNNHCYKFFRKRVKWSKADKRCKEVGANLASVTSAEENSFIADLVQNAPKRITRHLVWFGLRKPKKQWQWTDGSPLFYTNWARGEPGKNFLSKPSKCGNMYSKDGKSWVTGAKGKKGQWNDQDCSNGFSYICKAPK
ncbi:dromaiocalcin-1-like [Branchiostoma floridae x Branchiostoma belcheri]